MKRKTNLFYLSGDESNFLTFSNYGESLTGNFLATNWKICSDSDGQSIIAESYNDTIHLTEINLLCNLQKNITYYVFVQYIGTFGAISEWSDPIRIFNAEYKLTNSNRKIYRHQSGYGSVLEFNDSGIIRKVLILDAKYRKLENMSFGLFGINVDLDNYSKVLVSGRGSCFTRKQRKNCLRHLNRSV